MSLRDDELTMEDVVWLIGYLADNAPPDLLIPPRLAPAVKGYRKAYNAGRFTVAVPLKTTARREAGR